MLVIPRDLFNHGNLFRNYGQLYIQLETLYLEDRMWFNATDDNFRVAKDLSDGSTMLEDVKVLDVRGEFIELFRLLNSRETFSLWFRDREEDYEVFCEDGTLTSEFIKRLKK